MENNDILKAIEENKVDITKLFSQDAIKQGVIVAACPVFILNLSNNNASASAGCYLITRELDELQKILEDITKKDLDNIDNESLLFFSQRHLIELANILYGALSPMITNYNFTVGYVNAIIRDIIETISKPVCYFELKQTIDRASNHSSKKIKESDKESFNIFLDKICTILNYIWFVPYIKLDEFSAKIVEEFKNETKGE